MVLSARLTPGVSHSMQPHQQSQMHNVQTLRHMTRPSRNLALCGMPGVTLCITALNQPHWRSEPWVSSHPQLRLSSAWNFHCCGKGGRQKAFDSDGHHAPCPRQTTNAP